MGVFRVSWNEGPFTCVSVWFVPLCEQARQTLNEVRGALAPLNQRQQWCIDVLQSVTRLEQMLDARSRPIAVQVQASMMPGAGTGLPGATAAATRGNSGYIPPAASAGVRLATTPAARQ